MRFSIMDKNVIFIIKTNSLQKTGMTETGITFTRQYELKEEEHLIIIKTKYALKTTTFF